MLPLHWKPHLAKSFACKRFLLDSFCVHLTKLVMTPPISKAISICRHSFLVIALQWKHTRCDGTANIEPYILLGKHQCEIDWYLVFWLSDLGASSAIFVSLAS